MASKLPLVVGSDGLPRQLNSSADTVFGAGNSIILFGNKVAGGISTGVLDFAVSATCPAIILGYFIRHDATSVTVVFLKKASSAEPAYPTDSINSSGVTGATGITKNLIVTDFTTTNISTDDIIVPYIITITGTLTKFECGLIIQKQ